MKAKAEPCLVGPPCRPHQLVELPIAPIAHCSALLIRERQGEITMLESQEIEVALVGDHFHSNTGLDIESRITPRLLYTIGIDPENKHDWHDKAAHN